MDPSTAAQALSKTSTFRWLAGIGLGLGLGIGLTPLAQATATFGSLANFDSVNDSGKTAHGFEIDLEGIQRSDVIDVFGMNRNFGTASPGDVERYGIPVVSDLLDGQGRAIGVKVVYQASFSQGVWSASTSSGQFNTPGESCWAFGNVGYPNVPCDHFGVSTLGNPTRTTYSWLVEGSTPGSLVAANVAIPSVSFSTTPAAPVNAVIQARQVDPAVPQDNAYWVKIVSTQLPENADLNELLGGGGQFANPLVAAMNDKPETEIEWQVLQPGKVDEVTKALDLANDPSVVVRYEFYKYLGTFDGEGLVDPGAAETPHGNQLTAAVGDYVGEQIAAFNLNQPLVIVPSPVPEPSRALLMLCAIGLLAGGQARRRLMR